MSDTVSVDQLANAINAALQEYATLAAEDMKKCISDAGKTIRKEIRSHAPKESGQYGKSWRVKKMAEDSQTVEYIIYSPKDGGTADTARIGDIDFTPEEAEYKRALRFWDVIVEHKPQHPGEDFFSLYRDEYYRQYYGDRETYARTMAAFSTYAVVTPDGEWHQKGQMGWWGMSSETPEEAKVSAVAAV